jgi:hypothetical protein
MWTKFWDMHSGGGQKGDYPQYFIEAPEGEAMSVFYSRFGRNPYNITCTCCGEDYSVHEGESLEKITEFHRKDDWYGEDKRVLSMEEYEASGQCLIIRADEIEEHERYTEIPQSGWTWID